METTIVYWGFKRIMEKKMEATIVIVPDPEPLTLLSPEL